MERRLWTLDLLRAAAISFVLIHHCLPREAFPALEALRESFWCGVDLFFVLSGFLITGKLLESRGQEGGYRRFLIRRSARIFPLYYFWLLFYLGFVALGAPEAVQNAVSRAWPWLATYTYNILILLDGRFPPLKEINLWWSLAVEEQFYLLWPLLVLFTPYRAQLPVAAGLVITAISLKVLCYYGDVPLAVPYTQLLTRVDALLLGALAAYVFHHGRQDQRGFLLAVRLGLVGSGCALAWRACTGKVAGLPPNPEIITFYTPVIALFFTCVLCLCVRGELHLRRARPEFQLHPALRQPLRWWADISYGLYLCHLLVLLLLVRYFPGFAELPPAAKFALPVALSAAVSTLLFHALERPLQKLGRHLEPRALPAQPA